MLQIPWRTGVNMREFAYYNTSVRPLPPPELQRNQLTALKDMGVKLVRFYAGAAELTIDECVQNVHKALDLLDEFGMQAVICLDDALGSGFSVPGTRDLHTANGHYDKTYYGTSLYTQHYIPFIEALLGQLGDHPAVMIWELGNEHAMHPDDPTPTAEEIEAFFVFAKLASETIKRLSPRRLVSTGLLNSRQVSYALSTDQIKDFARRLYNLPSIDVIGIHYYEQDDEKQFGMIDIEIANDVDKPFYIGELGALRTSDRPTYYRQQFEEWKDRAFSVLPWAFDTHVADTNIGDDKAMARQYQGQANNDFDALCEIVRTFRADVERFVMPANNGHLVSRIPHAMAAAVTQKFFVVTFAKGLNIRAAPTVNSIMTDISGLQQGDIIEVDPASRTIDAENKFIWWHHAPGWSAEKSVDGATVFMEETLPPVEVPPIIEPPLEVPAQKFFVVTFAKGVNIRTAPTVTANPPDPIGLKQGDIIEVDPASRTIDAENAFIWWHHAPGWSAEKSVDGVTVFMEETAPPDPSQPLNAVRFFEMDEGETIDVNRLPMRDSLFTRLPVDLADFGWIQAFGNTEFAFKMTKDSYKYSQGLHGGIDLGFKHTSNARVVVRAGVKGKVTLPGVGFGPNRVRVNVGDDYMIIYGHLSNEVKHPDYVTLNPGDDVTEDTIIGEIAPRAELDANKIDFSPHLHLEVRYLRANPDVIVNPLMFMPDAMLKAVIAKSNGDGFHDWIKWHNHFDQPVIRWNGPIVGPRA